MRRTISHKTQILILLMFLGTWVSFSQAENTNWTVESYLVTINEVDVELTSQIKKQDATITWDQLGYNATDSEAFTITGSTGQWNPQTNRGELSYDLTLEDTTAILTITGTDEGISVWLHINGLNGTDSNNYVFTIETFNNQ